MKSARPWLWLPLAFLGCEGQDVVASAQTDATVDPTEAAMPRCGDAVVDPGEQCDEGGQTETCDLDCSLPTCDVSCTCMILGIHRYMMCAEAATFDQASALCAEHGMRVVRLDSAEENTVVRDAANALQLGSFWLGATDKQTEGQWVWEDGQAFYDQMVSLKGADGTPFFNNFLLPDPADDAEQDCAWVFESASWHDEPCASGQNVVCELY